MNRRPHLVMGVIALALASCGDSEGVEPPLDDPAAAIVAVQVAARVPSTAAANVAGQAISDFGLDLFTALRSDSQAGDDVTVSPASVAFALAMLEPGAVCDAQTQLRSLLRIEDPAAFHASMNALEQITTTVYDPESTRRTVPRSPVTGPSYSRYRNR